MGCSTWDDDDDDDDHAALCETLRENYFYGIVRLKNNITSGKCDAIYTNRV